MKAYRIKLKLRLVWWWVWWSVCALLFFGTALELITITIDFIFISHDAPRASYMAAKMIAFVIFVIPTFNFFPSVDKLISKDLNKDKVKLYAKAIMLERKIRKINKAKEEKNSYSQIEHEIEKMENELKDSMNEQNP